MAGSRNLKGMMTKMEIIDYLNERAYIEITDFGQEDEAKFYHPGMYPGDFRQAIGQHISRVKSGQITHKVRDSG